MDREEKQEAIMIGERRVGLPAELTWEVPQFDYPEARELPLRLIRDDARISPRLELCEKQVKLFGQVMRERGVGEYPPVVVAGPREDGLYSTVDGRHRVRGACLAEVETISVFALPWTSPEELYLEAVRLSARHGTQLTSEETYQMVYQHIRDWPQATTRELAVIAGTSHNFVAHRKRELEQGRRREPQRPRRQSPEQYMRKLLQQFDGLRDLVEKPADLKELQAAAAREERRYYREAELDPVRELEDLVEWATAMRALLLASA